MMETAAVISTILCNLQVRASRQVSDLMYNVLCPDETLCRDLARLWAYELAVANPDCTSSQTIIDFVEGQVPTQVVTPPGVVSQDCAITITDESTSQDCATITITVIQ